MEQIDYAKLDYEAQVEAAVAYHKLKDSDKEKEKALKASRAFIKFLDEHPDFKTFYILQKGAGGY